VLPFLGRPGEGQAECLADGVHLGRQQRAGAGNRRGLGDAVGRAFGAVRGAEGVVHEDVTQLAQFGRQFGLVLLLAQVQAAVLQHDELAGFDAHAIGPVRDHRNAAAHEFAHARGHRGQRVLGLELALGRAAQVAGDHDGGTGVQRHLDGRDAGADARVFGDVPGVVLRDVQVGADEDALALGLALGTEIGEADELHGGFR